MGIGSYHFKNTHQLVNKADVQYSALLDLVVITLPITNRLLGLVISERAHESGRDIFYLFVACFGQVLDFRVSSPSVRIL